MTARVRPSPKNKLAEIDESAKTESSANLAGPKQNLLKTRLVYFTFFLGSILLAYVIFHFGYISGQKASKETVNNQKRGSKETDNTIVTPAKLEFKVQWAGSENKLTRKYDKNTDPCELLQHCFDGFEPDEKTYPNDPFKQCHLIVERKFSNLDNGFMFEGEKLVGFASIDYKDDHHIRAEMRVYNVCVRKDDRGKGAARQLVPQLIRSVKEKRVTVPNIPVYAGLSVKFTTDSSALAFATYAKLGFIRWWQPCSGAHEINFHIIQSQESSTNPDFPVADYILKRDQTMKKLFVPDASGAVPESLCMVMKVGYDEFNTIGNQMKTYIKAVANAAKRLN